jgi:hypothetical protein
MNYELIRTTITIYYMKYCFDINLIAMGNQMARLNSTSTRSIYCFDHELNYVSCKK